MLPLFVFCGAASVHIAASYAIAQELAPPATAALFLPCAALAAAVLHAASYYAALPVLAGGQAATVSSEKAAHFWASTLACSLLAPTWLWHLVQAFGRLAGAYAAARGPWMTASQSLAAEDDVIILLLVGFYVYEIVLILTDVFPSKAAWLCHHGAALGIASYFLLAAREPVLRTTIVIGLLTHVSRPFRHAAFFAACLFGKGSAAAAYAGALFRVVLLFSDWPLIMAALAFYLAHGGASPLALLMGAPLVYAVSKWAWHDLLCVLCAARR